MFNWGRKKQDKPDNQDNTSAKEKAEQLHQQMLMMMKEISSENEIATLNQSPDDVWEYMQNMSKSFTILARRIKYLDPNIKMGLEQRAIMRRAEEYRRKKALEKAAARKKNTPK